MTPPEQTPAEMEKLLEKLREEYVVPNRLTETMIRFKELLHHAYPALDQYIRSLQSRLSEQEKRIAELENQPHDQTGLIKSFYDSRS
jgi:hypothetical protein